MKELLLFDPFGDHEIAVNHIKNFGFETFFVNSAEKVLESLSNHHFDLYVSEMPEKTYPILDYFEKMDAIMKERFCPHVMLTQSRDLYEISVAELHKFRDILFKPVEPVSFKTVLTFNLIPAKQINLLCSRKNSQKLEDSIKVFNIPYEVYTSWSEFSKVKNFNGNQLILFEEGFEGTLPAHFLNTLMTGRSTKKIPVIFFMNKKDSVLEKLVATYGASVILLPPFRWDVLELLVRQLIIKLYSASISEELSSKQHTAEEETPKEEIKKTEKIDPLDEILTGSLSVNQCLKVLPMKIQDPLVRTSFTQYLKTGNARLRETCLEKIDTQGGKELVAYLKDAYPMGNDMLRESIVDLFSDIKNNKTVFEVLVKACLDRQTNIQLSALQGLELYNVADAAPVLKRLLGSVNPKVKMYAAHALEQYSGLDIWNDFYRLVMNTDDNGIVESFVRYFEKNYQIVKDLRILLPLFQSGNHVLKEKILDLFLTKKDTRIRDYLPILAKTEDRVMLRMVIESYELCLDPKGLPFLLGQANARDADVAERAILSILEKHLDAKHVMYFQIVIEKGTDNLREKVIDLIKGLKPELLENVVKTALKFGGTGVKIAALELFMIWKNDMAVLLSALLLDDADRNVALHAGKNLKSIASKSHMEILIEAFKQLKNDASRQAISEILTQIVEGEDQNMLTKIMKKDSYSILIHILEKSGVSLGKYTTTVLGKHAGEKQSFDVLVKTLNDKNYEARVEAVQALTSSDMAEAKPHIALLLDDKEWYVRRVALEGLAKLEGKEFGWQILKCLKDANPAVRTQAANTLFVLDIKFQEALIPYLIDESSEKVIEQMLLLLSPFNSGKILTMHGPRMSSPVKATRIQVALEFLLGWETVDAKWMLSCRESQLWYLRALSMLYEYSKFRKTFDQNLAVYLKDDSSEVRYVLYDFILTKLESDKDKFYWCLHFVSDSQNQLKGKALTTITELNEAIENFEPLNEAFLKENDMAILNFYKELYYKKLPPKDEQAFFEAMSVLPEGIHKEIVFELVQRLNPAIHQQ